MRQGKGRQHAEPTVTLGPGERTKVEQASPTGGVNPQQAEVVLAALVEGQMRALNAVMIPLSNRLQDAKLLGVALEEDLMSGQGGLAHSLTATVEKAVQDLQGVLYVAEEIVRTVQNVQADQQVDS